MPRDKALKLAMRDWKRRNVTPDATGLIVVLDEIDEAGIAFDTDEHTDGICAVGFSFVDWAGDLHAISVPVPSTRFARQRQLIEDEIRNTKVHVEKMMGRGRT
jgi:DNA-binding IclR family transcriptional regulator